MLHGALAPGANVALTFDGTIGNATGVGRLAPVSNLRKLCAITHPFCDSEAQRWRHRSAVGRVGDGPPSCRSSFGLGTTGAKRIDGHRDARRFWSS